MMMTSPQSEDFSDDGGDLQATWLEPSTKSCKPNERWIFNFPEKMEDCLRPFDDTLIHITQAPVLKYRCCKAFSTILAKLLTAMVGIELGIVLPLAMFILRWDGLATRACFLLLFTAIVSQIPKRFLWRHRPWMASRAEGLQRPKTSSFPSRAVTCAVVYGFLLGHVLHEEGGRLAWIYSIVISMGIATVVSWARVVLGAHYPSDCLFGFISGMVICTLGTLMLEADRQICEPCGTKECYAANPNLTLCWDHLGRLNPVPLLVISLVGIVMVLLFMVPPVHFWKKGGHVFGLILPCIAFRFAFLCPSLTEHGSALNAPRGVDAVTVVVMVAFCTAAMLLGKLTSKLSRIASFLFFVGLYALVFFTVMVYRLSY